MFSFPIIASCRCRAPSRANTRPKCAARRRSTAPRSSPSSPSSWSDRSSAWAARRWTSFGKKPATRTIAYTFFEKQSASVAFQLQVAEAAMMIDTAHFHAYRAADDVDEAAARGVYPDMLTRARVRADTGYVVEKITQAIDKLMFAHGSGGLCRLKPAAADVARCGGRVTACRRPAADRLRALRQGTARRGQQRDAADLIAQHPVKSSQVWRSQPTRCGRAVAPPRR